MEVAPSHKLDSDLLTSYTAFFAETVKQIDHQALLEKLAEKSIHYDPRSRFVGVKVEPVKVERRGALVYFRVEIGCFTLMVTVLNLNERGIKGTRISLYSTTSIDVQEVATTDGGSCVSKRTSFRDSTKALKFSEDSIAW